MKFLPKQLTADGVFEVEVPKHLDYAVRKKKSPYPQADNITNNYVYVFNTNTSAISCKSLYLDSNNRLYFNGKKSRFDKVCKYYVDELISADK